jgi:hypothetical protein
MRINYDGTLAVAFNISQMFPSIEEALSNIINGSRIKHVTVELDDGQKLCLQHYHIEVRDIEVEIEENV